MRLGALLVVATTASYAVACAGSLAIVDPQAPSSRAPAPIAAPVASASPPPADGPAAAALPTHQARALSIVREIHGPKRRAVYETFADDFRATVSADKFDAIAAGIDARLGKLVDVRVLDEEEGRRSTIVYVAGFFARGARRYRVSLDPAGVVRGLLVSAFADDDEKGTGPADEYVAKRAYALPCRGKWVVGNGGRDPRLNHHVGNRQQWYAFDLYRRAADGKKHAGDGKRNEDFAAWEQLLGKVGNSGNSSAPHIHWHLATEGDASRGHGLPIRLAPMTINGARSDAPAPVRDDTIEP